MPGAQRDFDPPGLWRFGAAELDDRQARLSVGGRVLELDHASHEVLRLLLARSGHVVNKDQLLQAGWPGRVVSENSLTKAIGRLRNALDDGDGKVLATVHGYGYRLAVVAEFIAGELPAAATTAIPVEVPTKMDLPVLPKGGFRDQRRVLATGAALLLLLVAAAWQLLPRSATLPPRAPAVVAGGSSSIAVLPFMDLSPDHSQEYFSDGLADELLDQLAKVPQLRVAGRTSSFAFRGKNADVATIGQQLNVANVLEGSLRKSGDRIRITVQLIDVATGFHVWSETYDRKLTEVFAVQDDIARSVVGTLQLKLLPEQDARVMRHQTANTEAFAQYLLARKLRTLNTPDNDRRALLALERAIALDPKFAGAFAELGDLLGGPSAYADTPAEVAAGKQRSIALLNRAIELDPMRAETYLARADLLYSTAWDWAGAQRDLDKAAVLAPGKVLEHMVRQCRLLAALGRLPEAIALEQRAIQIDPSFANAWILLGFHSLVAGQYPTARAALSRARSLAPLDPHVDFYFGMASLLEGKPREARADFETSGGGFRLAGLAMAEHDAGQPAHARELLETLINRHANTSAFQIAEVYAWQGDRDQAFAWIERAERQHDAGLIYIKFDPLLAKLRPDPRYARWLRRMKFPA
ncbi:MAG: winged helix-turn-helix domain-containing protein [Arenimonas sp.]